MGTKQPPNVLFIFTDEQKYDTIAACGGDPAIMPRINAWTQEATVCERAYCTQPVCTPSRGSLMTGLWPHQHGAVRNNLPLPKHQLCLPELLPPALRATYRKAYFGKWHLGDEIFPQHGFDEWVSIEDGYHPYYSRQAGEPAYSHYDAFLRKNGKHPAHPPIFTREETARFPEELSKPAFLADEACRFLRENRENPFFLTLSILEPHMPFFGPRDQQHDPATRTVPRSLHHWAGPREHPKINLRAQRFYQQGFEGQRLQTESDWQQLTARYHGLCSLVDTHVGRILDTLAELGLDDSTFVIFTSDHGEQMGAHRLLGKGVQYEESIRVPWIMKLPGQSTSRILPLPVSQIDLVPTILEVMGARVPDFLPGRSLCPELNGAPQTPGDVFVEWNMPSAKPGSASGKSDPEDPNTDPIRTIISPDGWKLNYSLRLRTHELFHLPEDPDELHNLYGTPGGSSHEVLLKQRLRQWQNEVSDTVPLAG